MIERMNFSMPRLVKQIVWLAMLAVLLLNGKPARAFSPSGPIANGPDGYQTADIAYNVPGLDELSAPKNIAQEYRRNTPVMYYAPDANFLNFFGAQGVTALDNAFAIFNSVTNVNSYSTNLLEFPFSAERVNQRAQALSLMDLKSEVMGLMTEQLGLFQPVRAVWMLRARTGTTIPCTAGGEIYTVIQRNIDVVPDASDTFQFSSYVNNTLYSYFIFEDCGVGAPPDADAVEFPTDPLASTYTAVADYESLWYSGLLPGNFYTYLTRDDVGGLRYLLDTNNYNIESTGPGTFQFVTNPQPAITTNMDLGLFATQAATNPPAALLALYPGLIITSTVTNTFGLAVATNITEILTNSPYDPVGTPPSHPRFFTNYTTNVIEFFQYTFGNLFTNTFSTRGLVGTLSLSLSNSPYNPATTPSIVVTNAKFSYVNGVFGSFFLLPTNACGVQILTNLLTQVIATTNPPVGGLVATNLPAGAGGVATNAAVFTPGSITFFTNSTLLYLPVSCPPDTVATRQGVGQLSFLRRDFDSLLNQFWEPVTNQYTMYALTNGFIVPQRIERVATVPDFTFSASDLGIGVGGVPFIFSRNVNFDQAFVPAGQAGPGTIEPPSTITFNSSTPVYENEFLLPNQFFLEPTEQSQLPFLIWGSFDGTTNDPIVYPNGTSILQLEQQLLGPFITTASLPNGEVNVSYGPVTLTGTGGQPPYTWSLTPGSALPTGLTLDPTGVISGTPAGPPAPYDFSIRITDSAGATNDVPFVMTIDP